MVESEEILGMTFDLKSAYRQLAVSDASLKRARLAANDPHQRKTELYQQYSLPFGARGLGHCFHPLCSNDWHCGLVE